MKRFNRHAYSLIEVMAAAAIIAVGAGAAATLSASLSLQEEFARRVAVVRNYQETLAQLWQLGLTANDALLVMPTPETNRNLTLALHGTATVQETGSLVLGAGATATVETAICRAVVNISRDHLVQEQGSEQSLVVCRPSIR